jgi:hypothetical protein
VPRENLALREYLKVQAKSDREVAAILRRTRRDVDRQIKSILGDAPGAVVRREQLRFARRSIDDALARVWTDLREIIERQALVSGEVAVKVNGAFDRALIRQGLSAAEAAVLTQSNVIQARQAVQHAINRSVDPTGSTKRTLSEKVYKSRKVIDLQVDGLVNSALARGLSAREFAKEVSQFIRPDTPGGVRYAANRLARTEINNAFHHSQRQDNAAKPWVTGQKWHLSGSHPKPDECNTFAARNFGEGPGVWPKDDLPNKPHPNCLCYIEPVAMDEQEWLRKFRAGEFDDYLHSRMPVGLGLPGRSSPAKPAKPAAKPKPTPKIRTRSTPERPKFRDADTRYVRNRNITKVDVDYETATAAEKARLRDAVIARANEDVHIRMSSGALRNMLGDGRFKTVHEVADVASKRAEDYVKRRTVYEDAFMDYKGAASKDRPIYGYTGPGDQGAVSGYGDYTVTLKQGVKNRITVSAGDSLNGALDVFRPSELANLSEDRLKRTVGSDNSRALLKDGEFVQFMEAQIHGGVLLKDIDRITVPSDAPAELLDLLRKNGINYTVELSAEEQLLAEIAKKFRR